MKEQFANFVTEKREKFMADTKCLFDVEADENGLIRSLQFILKSVQYLCFNLLTPHSLQLMTTFAKTQPIKTIFETVF